MDLQLHRLLKISQDRYRERLRQVDAIETSNDSSYREMRDELIDSEQLLKSVPDGFNEVDKKYEDIAED